MTSTTKPPNYLQELKQKVLQKYGWSGQFGQESDGCWFVEVTVGLNDKRRFTAPAAEEETETDGKDASSSKNLNLQQQAERDGQTAAARVAMKGLESEIKKQEAKPKLQLIDIYPNPISVYESNKVNWDYFWENRPSVVGMDIEGNQKSPPVLVQIACQEYVILETPRHNKLSSNLQKLLEDDSITKVFCDNFSHRDKKALGIAPNLFEEESMSTTIVDLEHVAAALLGPVKVPRGLARILMLSGLAPDIMIEKPKTSRFSNVSRFSMIEQGKAPPLRSPFDLSPQEQQYAALDAWCTLQAYEGLLPIYQQQQQPQQQK